MNNKKKHFFEDRTNRILIGITILIILVVCLVFTSGKRNTAQAAETVDDSMLGGDGQEANAEEDPYPVEALVNGDYVRIRRTPNKEHGEIIKELRKGTLVTIIEEENNGWYHVYWEDKEGYIYAQYLDPIVTEYPAR